MPFSLQCNKVEVKREDSYANLSEVLYYEKG